MTESARVTPEPEISNDGVAPEVPAGQSHAETPEGEASRASRLRRERVFEVAAAIALAVVAVATAWSGYQATRWTDTQSARYAQASAQRVEATREATLAGQLRLYAMLYASRLLDASTWRVCRRGWVASSVTTANFPL